MKTIKIIDLIVSYANGEKQPRKIKFDNKEYTYNGNSVLQQLLDEYNIYVLNDEVEILDEEDEFEDIEELKKSDYQYSQCPSWKEKEEVIKIMNNNFELHQKAIRDIIENQKKIIERLKDE